MKRQFARIALVALVPTALDIGLLVWFRLGLGWMLVAADLAAVAVATVASYLLHRSITFRQDSFVRWVRMPLAFAAVATLAALVDVAVLRGLFAASGFDTVAGLTAAKIGSLACAAVVRFVCYRAVLMSEVQRQESQPGPSLERTGAFDLSVVVPAYSESASLAETITALRTTAAEHGVEVEVVVVDDGSPDDTSAVAIAAGADQVVALPHNRGKGAAVREGMLAARGRAVGFTDADLAYDPRFLFDAARLVDDGWEVVVGDRRHPDASGRSGATTLRSVGSRLINWATYAVLLGARRDTQCGLKVFRRDVAHSIFSRTHVDGFAFDVEVLHLVERDERSLLAIPVNARHGDPSTVRAGRDALRMLRDLWRIRHWSATGVYEHSVRRTEGSPGERVQ